MTQPQAHQRKFRPDSDTFHFVPAKTLIAVDRVLSQVPTDDLHTLLLVPDIARQIREELEVRGGLED